MDHSSQNIIDINNLKKRVLIVFGTRPEAIKMAPLAKEFETNEAFISNTCVTAQHREMLDQVLDFFKLDIDYDLDLMKPIQDLFQLTSRIISELKNVFYDFKPDYVFVHGDTTTTLAASLAAFYYGAKICHVEAGLRTYNKFSPFPEEINRQLTSKLADYHFAPTLMSKKNLLKEDICKSSILVTGNTVIDALFSSVELANSNPSNKIKEVSNKINGKEFILVTGHRRENHGKGFIEICNALKEIANKFKDILIIYPVHLNPKVQDPVKKILSDIPNIILEQPLPYEDFIWLMDKCKLIITDSGGVQEEAPSLGKPVLVMRDTTERPEAVKVGTVILVGTNKDLIVKTTSELIKNKMKYDKMSKLHNPYGDGFASKRIVEYINKLK